MNFLLMHHIKELLDSHVCFIFYKKITGEQGTMKLKYYISPDHSYFRAILVQTVAI